MVAKLELSRLFALFLDAPDKAGLAEEEPEFTGAFQLVPKCLVGMDGEVG
jgi:hypothetical protein